MNEGTDNGRPDWWTRNEAIREEMCLPSYDPPRFCDGTYTYEIIDPLEAHYDCEIHFLAVDFRYGDDWTVRIDGSTVMTVGRHRDEQGNTVYEMDADEFCRAVKTALESDI